MIIANGEAQMNDIAALGFIGLGVMGEPMCANLLKKSGLPVYAADLKREPLDRLAAQGLTPCASIGEVAANADLVFLSLPSGAEVEAVCFGPGGIADGHPRTRFVVDMSTSPVKLARDLADRFAARGIEFADAPVARTRAAARDGTLSITVGASAALFAAIRPFLACMGTDITHCGHVGNGEVVKILNNMVVFMTNRALAEALAIGRRAGVDGELLFDCFAKGSADSFILRAHGIKSMLPGIFPEDAFPTDYALKDMSYALDLAADTGINAEGAALAYDLLREASSQGLGHVYHTIIIKLLADEL